MAIKFSNKAKILYKFQHIVHQRIYRDKELKLNENWHHYNYLMNFNWPNLYLVYMKLQLILVSRE